MPETPVSPETRALLSAAAIEILSAAGPDPYVALVVTGGGTSDGRRLLSAVTASQLLARPIARPDAVDAVLAGLWLWP